MRRLLLLFCMVSVAFSLSHAQTTVLDFETATTSTVFKYFGNGSIPDLVPTEVIANPDKSGINTSDSVTRFYRGVNAANFAGAFSDPNPTTPMDLTMGTNMVYMKVWLPAGSNGNVVLKFEESTTGSSNWEQTVVVDSTQQWVDVAFDPSIADPNNGNSVAAGNSFNKIVVFFDFGLTGATDTSTYFFDDIEIRPAAPAAVTTTYYDFEASATSGPFSYFANGSIPDNVKTTVIANPDPSGINTSDSVGQFLRGVNAATFAGAFSDPNPATPVDLTTGTNKLFMKVWLPAGSNGQVGFKLEQSTTGSANWEQIVNVDSTQQWVDVEFDPTVADPNTAAVAEGNAFNRIVLFFDFGLTGATDTSTFYFDDIRLEKIGGGGPQDSVNITFNVNMSQVGTIDTTGVYIAGGGVFGVPGDNEMLDPDGDSIYTITFRRPAGFQSFYTFTNGACGDFSCKENLSGKPCGDPGNFNDRFLPGVMNDTTISTCFGECTTDGSCPGPVLDSVNVTFELNMALQDSIASTGVYIAGGGTFGVPGDNPMDDTDGDSVYTITFRFAKGAASFYTFSNGSCNGGFDCKEDIQGQSCADANNFNDRFFPGAQSDTTISTCFGVCSDNVACTTTSINQEDFVKDLFKLVPNRTGNFTRVVFGDNVNGDKQIEVIGTNGQQVMAVRATASQREVQLNVNGLAEGLYFVRVVAKGQASYQKMMIAR